MSAIAIAGMHRSGTSMVAKALRQGGLYLGEDSDLVPPAPDNPEGFFEHAGFVTLDEDLLQAIGGAWDQPPECPPMAADDPRVARFRDRALGLIGELSEAPTWGWKDPRTSLTARFWLDLVPELRVVVCLRDPLEVALSMKRRNRTSYAYALNLWRGYYETLTEAVPEERRIITSYDAHFRHPAAEAARLVSFAGLSKGGSALVADARDPNLRHHRVDMSLSAAGIDRATIELYERLREEADDPVDPSAPTDAPGSRARVDRNALDLHLAKVELEQRGRQVASLRREREELRARVAKLEGAARHGDEALAEMTERVLRLEDTVDEPRYEALEREGRTDIASLRSCRDLLRTHVPRNADVLVIAKGDPLWLELDHRSATNFPADPSGRYPGFTFAHSDAAIAHLEARRVKGSSFLLIPEISSWWTAHYPAFVAYLEERYEVVADQPAVGILADLRARGRRASARPRTIAEAVDRLAAEIDDEPSVLDWTGRDLAPLLPGRKLFKPPPGDELPYLERTIDIVLLDAADAGSPRVEEARRAARLAVVTVDGDPRPGVAGVEIRAPDVLAPDSRTPVPVRFVAAAADPDPDWLDRLREAVDDEPGAEVVAGAESWDDAVGDDGLIALVEEGVVPLPGCCDAARDALIAGEGIGAVAAKLFAADGSLEAAGTTVFADGSWTGVAAGSHKVVAPWHEHVREACGGAGVLFLDPGVLDAALPGAAPPWARSPTGWAAAVWGGGLRVVYRPDARAVRLAVAGEDPPTAAAGTTPEAWAPALPFRPPRPPTLDDRTWRWLLARDEVAAGWEAAKQPR